MHYTDQVLDKLEPGRKYAVPVMRKACIDILRSLFPDRLEGYQLTIEKRPRLVSFRASLQCLIVATTYNVPTLLPACYLYIGDRFYFEVFDVKKASLWPSDIPLTVYSNVVRNLRQVLKLKREVLDSFSEDWEIEDIEDAEHHYQILVLLTYYRGSNELGEFYDEDLALFHPDWMATDIAHCLYEELCVKCIAKWDNSQRKSWADGWRRLPKYLSMEEWETIRHQEDRALSAP